MSKKANKKPKKGVSKHKSSLKKHKAKLRNVHKSTLRSKLMLLVLTVMSVFGVSHYYDDLKPFIKYGVDHAVDWIKSSPSSSGNVVSIADGDTITLIDEEGQRVKVRLYGVDAPEGNQTHGKAAKRALQALVANKNVQLEVIDTDVYGRKVGIIRTDEYNVNEEMLKNGHAWVYGKYCNKMFCDKWKLYELAARQKNAGLWTEKYPTPPWKYRSRSQSQSQSRSR